MKPHTATSFSRLTVQCISLLSFLLLIFNLSYPLGAEVPLLQWFSRFDPWSLFSQLRWQRELPFWVWAPLLTLAATLLWGRVFCSWFCPFGALLSLVDKVGRALFKSSLFVRMRTVGLRCLQPIRYYWLLFLIIVFLLGSNWAWFLTPFVLFSHEIVRLSQGSFPWMLIGIVVGTLVFSRIWCSVICPTGMLLALTARLRFTRYSNTGECLHCGKCLKECPVNAAVTANGAVKEWCLVCGACQKACPTQAISWEWLPHRSRRTRSDLATTRNQPSRRQFLATIFTFSIASLLWKKAAWASKKVLRPPGARKSTEFSAVCNRCSKCIQVCPNHALWPMDISDGITDFETPQLIPRKGRCDLCLACQEVCPTGAIEKTPIENISIGKASIEKQRCLAWNEQKLCFLCGEQCPFQAIVGDAHHRPTVITDKCVGCGSCENGCPIEGMAAIRVMPQ